MDGTLEWTLWGLEASLTVDDVRQLEHAKDIVDRVTDQVERACSRFRDDSEVMRLQRQDAGTTTVSRTLALLLQGALQAAERTEGDVDPLLGHELALLGYDTDFSHLVHCEPTGPQGTAIRLNQLRTGLWRQIRLEGRELTLPRGGWLDLGATAKAQAADWAAARIAERLGVGTLVSLGGDLATAGDRRAGDWQILVRDLPGDRQQQVSLRPGHAMATSSTQKRRWTRNGTGLHHILDPRSGRPADPVWRTVTVAAATCLEANTFSTAAVVRGTAAPGWLESLGLAARLVHRDGTICHTPGWPLDAALPREELRHG